MKKKKLLIIAFLIVSMIMNSSMTVLATTVETISELEQNETAEEETEPELADFVVEDDTLPFLEDEKEEEQPEESVPEELVQEDTKETDADSQTENIDEMASKAKEENIFEEEKAEEVQEVFENVTKELSAKYTSKNGSIYAVTLTYGTDANIPDGSTLQVKEIFEGTSEYNEAREAVLADKEAKNENADADRFNMVALDISIRDAKNVEIEPATPVSVEIKIESLPGVDDLKEIADSLEIQHHIENGDEKVIDYVVDSSEKLNIDEKVIETKFDVESFSVFTISWQTTSGWNTVNNTATIHYGYMNGNSFVEFDSQPTPQNVENTTSHRAYLIYDFDGYQYSGNTYYRASASETGNPATGGTRIQALLRYGGGGYGSSNRWQYRNYSTNTNGNWNDLADKSHIYVVYESKPEAVQGGTPKTQTNENAPKPAEPDILKESDDNGDGTRTLSLSITGHTEKLEAEKLADVIVIFDVSGSMSEGMGTSTRLQTAKNAVNNMANTLLSKTNSSGDKLIRMSLISFSTTATVAQGFTDNYNTFRNAVNNLKASGGTNWEQALKLANQMAVDPDRATFVIFVSDGDPTFRVSRMNVNDSNLDINDKGTDTYYISNSVFGTGNSDPGSRNYNAALEEAKSIVDANKYFYTIGISNDVTNMANLNSQAGGDGNYTATSSATLSAAFDSIAASMNGTLGWNATISDGITGLTNLTAKAPVVGFRSTPKIWEETHEIQEAFRQLFQNIFKKEAT